MIKVGLLSRIKKGRIIVIIAALLQWLSMLANVLIMFSLVGWLKDIITINIIFNKTYFILIVLSLFTKGISIFIASQMLSKLSGEVRKEIRVDIYEKLFSFGLKRQQQFGQAELIQLTVEGVEQLDLYFSIFLPQIIYGILSPISVLVILAFFSWQISLALLLSIPLIPLMIIFVNKRAKNRLSLHWDEYSSLGDIFLDMMQGLTTLKLFNADSNANDRMNLKAESFRKSTMGVLKMQLNSITIMDLVAFGGAALAIVIAIIQMNNGRFGPFTGLFVILLCADFFLPLRALGSSFHIATNGIAAYAKIEDFLNLEVTKDGNSFIDNKDITCNIKNLTYYLPNNRLLLKDININIPTRGLTALVGLSGSGKSTLAKILIGYDSNYDGKILFNNLELNELSKADMLQDITYVSSEQHLFNISIRDNLKLGNKDITDNDINECLKQMDLYDFVYDKDENLDFVISEQSSNISGGQKQRLIIARALLMDKQFYIFDEVTSSVDYESEVKIMKVINNLSKRKSVLLITHNLINVKDANNIYVLHNSIITEKGSFQNLINRDGIFAKWYLQQTKLINKTHKNTELII